jgi:pimeloyl-ACP methyl ester carboxylesterase
MPKASTLPPDNFIMPLNMNGLQGRMLRMPPKGRKKKEILFIPGHHTNLERVYGVAEALNQYGGVTIPDLPGFGGMQSFYRLGDKPTLDNFADYLAAFIKLRFHRKRITVIGFSFGFAVVTRMLQKYPDIAAQVDDLISLVGVVRKDDFKFKRSTYFIFRWASSLFSTRLIGGITSKVFLRRPVIEFCYRIVEGRHSKLKDADEEERKRRIAFEVTLWKQNDFRTWMDTTITLFRLNLCTEPINLPVHHINVQSDRYFDHDLVEQHMRIIFTKVDATVSKLPNHAPSVVATKKDAQPFFPPKIRRILSGK